MLSHDTPFHYVGEDVEIGVPSRDDQPPEDDPGVVEGRW